MSLKSGNALSAKKMYSEAIAEYKKVDAKSPLYYYAKFNIDRIETILKEKKGIKSKPEEILPPHTSLQNLPLLSIIMPVFNIAPYLDASILSALSQRYQNFELIIINDASTDNSRRIIEMHRSHDSRIRFIDLDHNTLGGAGIPSNIGIHAARGEYIAFIDSDDWTLPDAFANMMEQALKYDADIVIGTFCTFTDDERVISPAYDRDLLNLIPKNKPISLQQYSKLFRLSPVPWRKIYKRNFLVGNKIEYPEGDYFYEDNPLHWFVLSKAERIVATEDIVSYHRMAREGQTMNAAAYKLSAICCHINTIFNYIKHIKDNRRETIFTEFYDYCYRNADWVLPRQVQPAAQCLIKKHWASIVNRATKEFPLKTNRTAFSKRIIEYTTTYPDIDLTIVMPVFNSADLVRDSLNSILKIKNLKFNVLIVNDGSTDESLKVIQEYETQYSNIHVFTQGNRGAGRARNSLIPMCTGTYTYFMDADDTINADNLIKAVQSAKNNNQDLYFFKYRIEFWEEQKSRDMFNDDTKLWVKLKDAQTNQEKQKICSQLINYPWNRIIKTELLHDANIFFGGTIVHNDIPYHWHSIVAAQNIGYSNDAVCTHRKFTARNQITNITDSRRMGVLEALRFTHEVVSHYPQFENISTNWREFSSNLLKWAEERLPVDMLEIYKDKERNLLAAMEPA